jgi:cytochrome c oxidase subunit IV
MAEARAHAPEAHPAGGPDHAALRPAGHVVPLWQYFAVYFALLALTALTVFTAFLHLGLLNNVVALGIAATKALLVVLYFMHVRWSSRLVALCVAVGVLFVVHMVSASMSDYLTRGLLGVPGR